MFSFWFEIYYAPESLAIVLSLRVLCASGGDPYVPEHQDPVQLRAAGDGGGAARRFAAVRAEGHRLQQAVQGERGRVLRRGRRDREDRGQPSQRPRNQRAAQEPGRAGRQGEGPRRPTLLGVKTPPGYQGNLSLDWRSNSP